MRVRILFAIHTIMRQTVLLTNSCSNMSTCASLLFCAGQSSPHRLKKRLTQLFDEAVWHQPSVLLLEKLDHAMPHVADAQEAVVDVDGSNGVKRAQGSLLVISFSSVKFLRAGGHYHYTIISQPQKSLAPGLERPCSL